MPSVAPCKPCEAKRWLERAGYKLALETASNWFLVHEDEAAPVTIPRLVQYVPLWIANDVARRVGMASYIAWWTEANPEGTE